MLKTTSNRQNHEKPMTIYKTYLTKFTNLTEYHHLCYADNRSFLLLTTYKTYPTIFTNLTVHYHLCHADSCWFLLLITIYKRYLTKFTNFTVHYIPRDILPISDITYRSLSSITRLAALFAMFGRLVDLFEIESILSLILNYQATYKSGLSGVFSI